ncbi:hypothetical protein IB237_10695 [Agrobacterium sp. AGB01]|uniref:Imm50 family immunity protein n=1 Tax=Agrobacterium sp. AGB01 TaxID=2769302 RepID=UPI0017868107|nr:Imm50 family immunity protein [Agrobacterium sp. AGB01]MBD9387644.1 hypothetical protein [Agrobacterium sp. AGB01]
MFANTQLLENVFGAVPEMTRVELVRLDVEYGRAVSLQIILTERAISMPPKWQDFNTVGMRLRFWGVERYSVSENDPVIRDISYLQFSEVDDRLYKCVIRGQINAEIIFDVARPDEFFPALLNPEHSVTLQ